MAEIRVKETGTIKLFESDNTSSVTIASPASLGADRTITLPDASVTLASGTMLATDGSGASLTALNASELGSGTVPDARFPATLPAASGVNLTSLTATNLGSGTVPTARLGSGTASSSTVLYGDQTYKAEPGGGKILQVQERKDLSNTTHSTDSYTATGIYDSITPSSTDSDIFVNINYHGQSGTGSTTGVSIRTAIFRDINGGGYSQIYPSATPSYTLSYSSGGGDSTERYIYSIQNQTFVDSPATTDVVTYKLYARRGTTGGSNAYIGSGQQQNVILMEIDGS